MTHITANVEFFDKEGAEQLIHAYAATAARPGSYYQQHPEQARDFIATFFDAIETFLGLPAGELWQNERGKVFAGYAPVLAALGSILAAIDDFTNVAKNLKADGGREAWGVIEAVLYEILGREQDKLRDVLSEQCESALPNSVYDVEEQLSLLAQYVSFEAAGGRRSRQALAAGHGKIQRNGPNLSTASSLHAATRIWRCRPGFGQCVARRLSRHVDFPRAPDKPVATMAPVGANASAVALIVRGRTGPPKSSPSRSVVSAETPYLSRG